MKWYVSFQHFSYSIWSFLQKHDNVHFKAPQEDKKPIYLTKEYGLCQQNWQEIRCHCGTVVCCAALWTKKIQKGQVFYPHPALLHTGKKKRTHISAQIIVLILLRPASSWSAGWSRFEGIIGAEIHTLFMVSEQQCWIGL